MYTIISTRLFFYTKSYSKMSVELLMDKKYKKIYKHSHYLFTRDERTIVDDGYCNTLYVIDLNYVQTHNVNHIPFNSRFDPKNIYKSYFDPKNMCKLKLDLDDILNNIRYDSEIISEEDLEICSDLLHVICLFLDIDTTNHKIVHLKSYTFQPYYFDIYHGGTCIVLKNDTKSDLNVITNLNTLIKHHKKHKLQNVISTNSEIILMIKETLETYKFNKETDFIRIVSPDVYNNCIKKVNVEVTLEDPKIDKYIELYDEDKHKIMDADFIIELDGDLQNVVKFRDIIN